MLFLRIRTYDGLPSGRWDDTTTMKEAVLMKCVFYLGHVHVITALIFVVCPYTVATIIPLLHHFCTRVRGIVVEDFVLDFLWQLVQHIHSCNNRLTKRLSFFFIYRA